MTLGNEGSGVIPPWLLSPLSKSYPLSRFDGDWDCPFRGLELGVGLSCTTHWLLPRLDCLLVKTPSLIDGLAVTICLGMEGEPEDEEGENNSAEPNKLY